MNYRKLGLIEDEKFYSATEIAEILEVPKGKIFSWLYRLKKYYFIREICKLPSFQRTNTSPIFKGSNVKFLVEKEFLSKSMIRTNNKNQK